MLRHTDMGNSLKIYAYNISPQYNIHILNHVEAVAYSKLRTSNWLSNLSKGYFTHFENLRTHGADNLILRKFLKFARLTTEPSEADLYLVPFLGGLDTILGWGHGLSRINSQSHQNILNWNSWASRNLQWWKKFSHRHIVLFNMNSDQVPKSMNSATVLHLGPSRTRPHHIIVPYLILEKTFFEARRSQNRDIFAYVQMTSSRNPVRKIIRQQLWNRPHVIVDTRVIGKLQEKTIRKMHKSKFCITPAGDSSSFCTRFYFALLSGCIPVRIDTYNSYDSYPYVGESESLRDLVVNVSPREMKTHGLINILNNVTDVHDKINRIQNIRQYLLYDPSDLQEDAFTMIIKQLFERKRCSDEVSTVRSLHSTHIGTSNQCFMPVFDLDEEMCWKNQIDITHVYALRQKIVTAAISC